MKTIGLLGGMSWESTAEYYRMINEGVKNKLGGLHSAQIAMVSVDFEPIEKMMKQGNWKEISDHLSGIAKKIQAAGADGLMICTNTMHKLVPNIEATIDIPVLHIADATAEQLIRKGVKTVGLLGTAATMEQEFYKERLSETFGLTVLTPNADDRMIVHDIIFNELCLGKILDSSKTEYLRIISDLASQGAETVILGCTEIGLLIQPFDTSVDLIDTTVAHAQKAVEWITG